MKITVLDGTRFRELFLSGAANIEANKEQLDALNVFPVPDGDTGTNMALTLASAVKEIDRLDVAGLGVIAEAAARGSLMGARGNSGVILSQLIRGMARELKGLETVDVRIFARSLETGIDTAFKAVMKPMEGTILTVARDAARAAVREAKKSRDFCIVLQETVKAANMSLQRTPELLPVLKQAGVVDAGAMGWVVFLEGMTQCLTGSKTLEYDRLSTKALPDQNINRVSELLSNNIEFQYCTELFVIGASEPEPLRNALADMGDSLLVVGDQQTVKVHIHTGHPGLILEKCLEFGAIDGIKIENMVKQIERKPYSFVVVTAGEGLEKIFISLGADKIVSGGQTNNPSTEELVKAVNELNANLVYILPNNSNVVMTARQAAKLAQNKAEVIPAKSIPQGLAAMVAFQPEKEPVHNTERMLKALDTVKTGEVTFAIRDTIIDDKEIKKGDILGIADDKMAVVGEDVAQVTIDLIQELIDDNSEVVTAYFGADIDRATAEGLIGEIAEKYPEVEFEILSGGQSLYYFLISVE